MLVKCSSKYELSFTKKFCYTDEILATGGCGAPNPCYVAQIPVGFYNHIITLF